MNHIVLYYRELLAGYLLNAAMFVAPKRMEYHIAKGLSLELKKYAEHLQEIANADWKEE